MKKPGLVAGQKAERIGSGNLETRDMTILSERLPKARKAHQCHWCSEPIKRGERYVSISQVDGGEIYTLRLHTECKAAMNREIEGWLKYI